LKPLIAITVGDFNGIGPEIALKAARRPSVQRICTPILVGPLDVFRHTAKVLKLNVQLEKTSLLIVRKSGISVVDVGDGIPADITFGKMTKAAGRSAGVAIEKAVELCVLGRTAAMVTAPVSKEGLTLAGYNFPGQTEMVALLSRSQRVVMMLIAKSMRIGLVTIHIPVRAVADQLTAEKVLEKGTTLSESLRRDFGIRQPRIAVLGLNPHAGENGLLGTEERDIIGPAIRTMQSNGLQVDGPFAADGFFGTHAYRRYDAVLAMYHDQGLIPLKMAGFAQGVNYSAGLNIVRTSPDHGVAYELAGKNKANIASMLAAISLAVSIWKRRNVHD